MRIKNIFTLLIMLSVLITNAQITIGKSEITKLSDGITPNPSISLEFFDEPNNAKGILLPWVSTVPNQPVSYNTGTGAGYNGMSGTVVDGTIIFDLADTKIKYMKAGSWFDLTGNPTFPLTVKNDQNADVVIPAFNTVDSSIQDNKADQANAKAVIGQNAQSNTATGILVLADSNKGMVLPKVANPHLTIKNPSPGMMAYDTVKRQLAVFNGTVWSFWKP